MAVAIVVPTVVALVPDAPALASGKVPGIDVSMYQRRIDWRQVGATRLRFAILRASLGNSYVDARYRRNLNGASAHGLVVGAYHYAKPSPAPWDAGAEANHFLRVARNAPGDVVPVLDIEETGGLGRKQLWRWTKQWLTRVRERTGLRAMIYTASSFWTHSMGNTSWFARHGYPHWVAHWYVRRPDVPGRGWGGTGWTVWQWSASGRVPGIPGPVDLDWFAGRDLSAGTIGAVTVRPSAGGTVFGPMLACGSGRSQCTLRVNPGASVTIRAVAEPGARFVRWTGACAPAGTAHTCRLIGRDQLAASAVFAHVRSSGGGSSERGIVAPAPHPACRPIDPDCAIAALLSAGLGAQLREVLPALLDARGRGLGSLEPSRGR